MVHKNYSDKELLDLLESSPEDDEGHQYPNTVLEFIGKYKIVIGDFPVPEKTLYRLYKTVTKHPLSKREFTDIFSSVFIRRISGYTSYYKIDKESLDLANDVFKLINDRKYGKMVSVKKVEAFKTFLRNKNLAKGTKWIEGFILYAVFKKTYTDHGRAVPLGYDAFFNFCKLSFPYKRITENRSLWFGVNNDIGKELTEEQKEKIYKKRRKKKRNTKKRKV